MSSLPHPGQHCSRKAELKHELISRNRSIASSPEGTRRSQNVETELCNCSSFMGNMLHYEFDSILLRATEPSRRESPGESHLDSLPQVICLSPEWGTLVGMLGSVQPKDTGAPRGAPTWLCLAAPHPAHSGCCPRCCGRAWGSGRSRRGHPSRKTGQSGKALMGAMEPGLRPMEGPSVAPLLPLGAWGSRSPWVCASQGRPSLAMSVPGSDVLVHAHTCPGPTLMPECVCAVCVSCVMWCVYVCAHVWDCACGMYMRHMRVVCESNVCAV